MIISKFIIYKQIFLQKNEVFLLNNDNIIGFFRVFSYKINKNFMILSKIDKKVKKMLIFWLLLFFSIF